MVLKEQLPLGRSTEEGVLEETRKERMFFEEVKDTRLFYLP